MVNKRIVELKNGKKFLLRYMKRSDLNCIWHNFNQVIDEGVYLPTYNKVTTEYEKRAWYNEIVDLGNICLVAEDQTKSSPNNVVCQCTIEHIQWEASSHVAVLGVIVEKENRSSGLGYELLHFALEQAKKKGKKKIILSTLSTNKSAVELYDRVGFKKVGYRDKHFFMSGSYIDEILMEIWIGNELPKRVV